MVTTESWQVCGCRFESYLAHFHSRCGDALVGRPSTPWMINKLAGGPQTFTPAQAGASEPRPAVTDSECAQRADAPGRAALSGCCGGRRPEAIPPLPQAALLPWRAGRPGVLVDHSYPSHIRVETGANCHTLRREHQRDAEKETGNEIA